MIRFNSIWVTTPSQVKRYTRQLALPSQEQDEAFPRTRLLLSRKLIPFFAYGQLTLGEKKTAFETLNPTFSTVAVFQFYHLDRRLTFSFSYDDLILKAFPQPVPNPIPVNGDWVSLTNRSNSVEYWLASSSAGAELYAWLRRSVPSR